MQMNDSVTLGLVGLLYVGIVFMYLSKIKAFWRLSEESLLKVESRNFFFSRKMHNITTVMIIALFMIQFYREIVRGRLIFGSIIFALVLIVVLTVHFKSMSTTVWLIMKEGVLLYGQRQIIEWKYIENYSWNMNASNRYNELYLSSEKNAKARNKLRLIIDKELSKEAQKLFKKFG